MMEFLASTFVFLSIFGLYRVIILRFENRFSNLVLSGHHATSPRIVSGVGLFLLLCLFYWRDASIVNLLVIAVMVVIGFLDDRYKLGVFLRLTFYAVGALLILLFHDSIGLIPLGIVVLMFVGYVGFVNAVNFMDGINGLVLLQSVVILMGMLWSNEWQDSESFLWILLGFMLAFGFFNLRSHALLFLGDAGSIGLGFIVFALLLNGIVRGLSWGYLIYFAVIAVEVVSVLVMRFFVGYNVLERHQKHLYQRLVFGLGCRDVYVSVGYATLQLTLIVLWECQLKYSAFGLMLVVGIYLALFALHRWSYLCVSRKILIKCVA